jgi:hypothetical protein
MDFHLVKPQVAPIARDGIPGVDQATMGGLQKTP